MSTDDSESIGSSVRHTDKRIMAIKWDLLSQPNSGTRVKFWILRTKCSH